MKTTAAIPTSQPSPRAVLSDAHPKAFITRIFTIFRDNPELLKEKTTLSSTSILAKWVSEPAQTATAVVSHDEKTHTHYAAYCKLVGVEPLPIEHWDSLRNKPSRKVDRGIGRAFEYRNTIAVKSIVNWEVKNVHARIALKSLWCEHCKEYVEQSHTCQQPADAHLEHWPYYKTATALRNAQPLLLANKQRREQEQLQRLADFMSTTPAAHKVVWVRSFGGLFAHMISRLTSVADLIVVVEPATYNTARVEQLKPPIFEPRAPLTRTFAMGKRRADIDPEQYFEWLYPYSQTVANEYGAEWQRLLGYAPCANFFALSPTMKPNDCKHGLNEKACALCAVEGSEASSDFLPVPRCKHPLLKSFTFSNGETIKMCPDCTAFDDERSGPHGVLNNGHTGTTPSQVVNAWDAKLNAEGLSAARAAFHPSLCWGDLDDLGEEDHAAGDKSFSSGGARVNTAGCDGVRNDSSARDRRAKQWQAEQQRKEPDTQSIDWWSGETIYDRAGTNFNTSTRNRQRFWEEWWRLRMHWFEIAIAQEDDMLLRIWLFIESKRS